MRCLHLSRAGRQCRAEALDDGSFCAWHVRVAETRFGSDYIQMPPVVAMGEDEDDDDDGWESSRPGVSEMTVMEDPEIPSRFPLIYRLAALALLAIFLANAYHTVRSWLGR